MSEIYLFIMCEAYCFSVQHLQINQSSPLSCEWNFKNILANISREFIRIRHWRAYD